MERTATRSESLLRPREIQVRIRAGQTPETVAAAAQTSVDRVMAYATPVLAERAFVAQQAARASVRRRAGDGPVGQLGDAATQRLESVGVAPDAADWDAWRREDGRWTVVSTWVEGGEERRAEFTYDAMGRYVVAEDDAARWLVGERRAADAALQRIAPAVDPVDTGRLAGDPSEDLAGAEDGARLLALGDDALEVVTGRPLRQVAPRLAAPPDAAAVRADAEPTEDLTETVRAVRAVGNPAPEPAPAPALQVTPDPTPDPTPEPSNEPSLAPVPAGDGLFEDTGLRTPADTVTERRAARAAGGSRTRRSMPSWDDIMLGSAPKGD